jgi:hypothetical protein
VTFRRGLLSLAAALCGAALLLPAAAVAQEEPTPFWMPVEPEKPAPKQKKEKPAAKKKQSADDEGSQVYIAGDADDDAPKGKKKGGKGTVKAVRPVKPAKKAKAAREPDYDDPPPEPKPRKKAFEPLPAFPHLEPEVVPQPAREPSTAAPAPSAPAPIAPAAAPPGEPAPAPAATPGEEPVRRPVLRPKKEAFGVEEDEPKPAAKPPAPAPAPAPEAAPAKKDKGKTKPAPAPAPARPAPRAAEPAAVPPPERPRTLPALPGVEPAPPPRSAPIVTEPVAPAPAPVAEVKADEPEEYQPVALRWRRNLWVLAQAGGWQKPHGDARGFELAYGLQLGWAPAPWLLLDLSVVRAGQQQGNGFANARVDHTSALVRGFVAWNRGLVSLFAGGGAGGVLAQTVYTLQDVGQPASTLPATAFRLAAQVGAGARMRPWRGLEVRAEVTTLLRDGRLEPLVTFGAGWAF